MCFGRSSCTWIVLAIHMLTKPLMKQWLSKWWRTATTSLGCNVNKRLNIYNWHTEKPRTTTRKVAGAVPLVPFLNALDAVLGYQPAFCPGEGDVIDSEYANVSMVSTNSASDKDNGSGIVDDKDGMK